MDFEDTFLVNLSFIRLNLLLKYWKKELKFNYKVLSRFSKLILFNVNFPCEIIVFINYIYLELRKEEFNKNNLCPCKENKCQLKWYEMRLNLPRADDGEISRWNWKHRNLKENWDFHHCNVIQKNGVLCHNLCLYNKKDTCDDLTKEERDSHGFKCDICSLICCIECLASGHKDRLFRDSNNKNYGNDCIECHLGVYSEINPSSDDELLFL